MCVVGTLSYYDNVLVVYMRDSQHPRNDVKKNGFVSCRRGSDQIRRRERRKMYFFFLDSEKRKYFNFCIFFKHSLQAAAVAGISKLRVINRSVFIYELCRSLSVAATLSRWEWKFSWLLIQLFLFSYVKLEKEVFFYSFENSVPTSAPIYYVKKKKTCAFRSIRVYAYLTKTSLVRQTCYYRVSSLVFL